MSQLDDILERLTRLDKDKQEAVRLEAFSATKHIKWLPNPGPQTDAYYSKADILLYGGEPGGGKSELLLGLAFNCHKRSLIMRRQYTDLAGLTDAALRINGSRIGYSGSPPPSLRLEGDRIIEFGAAKTIGDEQHWQGRPHDLLGFDEGSQFAYQQVRFLMGWLRHENPEQRCRVVIATNPPLQSDGLWVKEMFAAWLSKIHSNPAKPGELRWFITDEEGKDREVPNSSPVEMGGRMVRPLSRTFIPASVDDNPYYAKGNYRAQLDALTEPYRSILLGGFDATFKDAPNQVIPTQWILDAQSRWTPKPPEGIPMCNIGVDASGGGDDPLVLAPRYDGWFAPLIEINGKSIPLDAIGSFSAGIVIANRRDGALVTVDMGGGYGGSLYEHLVSNGIDVRVYKGAESTNRRSRDGKIGFTNKRGAAYWSFREALDPGQPGGSPIALPYGDSKLLSDLATPTFSPTPHGIKIETKEDVCKRLGRSTDRGDAVVMSWFEGAREITNALEWIELRERKKRNYQPKVLLGRAQPLSTRVK